MGEPIVPYNEDHINKLQEQLRDLLSLNYLPVADSSETEDMCTTEYLFDIVNKHSPGEFLLSDMRQLLLSAGYKEHFVGNRYMWLVKHSKK
jgi:hypothetical protein